jgi:hypothetical protein
VPGLDVNKEPMRRFSGSHYLRPSIALCLSALATASLLAQIPKKGAPAPSARSARGATPAPAAPARAAERPTPFKANESLKYDVSWSSYLTAGIATLTVREKRPSFGSTAYYIVGEGRPTGLVSSLYSLYYKADTLLDAYTLLPQRGSLFSQEGKRRRMKVTRFDQAAHSAEYQVQTASTVKKTVPLPTAAQDVLSAVYVLRALRLTEGDRFAMPVCDGGSMYRVMFEIGRRESVKSGVGTLNAFRITLTVFDAQRRPVGRPIRVWLSDDPRRLPLKLQADLAVGSIQLLLSEAR